MPTASITVVGRLTRDVEKQSERAPHKSAVAVDGMLRVGEEFKTKFFDISVWPGTSAAGLIANLSAKGKTLVKGQLLMVTGTPTYETYTDSDGVTKERDGIKVDRIDFIPESKRAEGTSGNSQAISASGSKNESAQDSLASDEEIPLV